MSKKQKILITDFDGFNVHNPDNSNQFIETPTFEKAKEIAKLIEDLGFERAKKIIEALK
jgi:hypothetical protein